MRNYLLIKVSLLVVVVFGFGALSGCATNKPQTAIDQTREVNFDKRLLQDCERIPALVSSREEDVQDWVKKTLKIHSDCATFKAQENVEIKKALNIKS